METLLDQLDAGQSLRWPLRFEEKKEEAPEASPKHGKSKNPRSR
jgi:hypothetical protein